MEADIRDHLLAQARHAYTRADADPAAFAPQAAALTHRLRTAGHPAALVVALRAQAWAERGRLAEARAKSLLDEAARLAARHDLPELLGEVLVTRAAVNHELGRLHAAQHDLDAAAPLVRGEALTQLQLQQAVLHQNSGRLAQAAATYRALLARAGTPVDVRGKVGNNLGMIEALRGQTSSALRHLDDAARAAEQVGPALAASIVQTRGWVLVQAGRLSQGLRLFDQAARAFEAAGLPLGELHMEYADAMLDLRLLPEAVAATNRAAQQFQASGVPLMAAEAQLRAARLELLDGAPDTAAEAAQQAARAFRSQRRPAWAARADVVAVEARARAAGGGRLSADELRTVRRAAATLERLGVRSVAVHAHLTAARVALGLGRAQSARGGLRRAHELSRGAPVLVRLDGRVAAAMHAQLDHRDADVARQCRAGLEDLARHRGALPSMELRALAWGHGVELGRMGTEVALRSGSPTRMLAWLERTRASGLALVAPAVPTVAADSFAALRDVHARLTEPGRQDPGQQAALLAEQREIEDRLRRATWVGSDGAGGGLGRLDIPGLRRSLGGRVLVEYGALGGELHAVVLEPRQSRLLALGPVASVAAQVDALLFALRRLARPSTVRVAAAGARAGADAALTQLRRMLLAPLGLAPDVPLVLVPSTALLQVPWLALHPAAVSLAPSARAWQSTLGADGTGSAGSAGPASRVVLVAGPDLPGAVEEVRALHRVHAGAQVLHPPLSTVDAVARALDGAGLAHLACHGRLRADNPTFSSLWLSDGPLTLQELDDRALAPRRIVLASCESGAHVGLGGDELLGFVSALLSRGTRGVVASAVPVPDAESVPLMCALHRQVRAGATLGDALHTARADMDLESPGAFAAWCSYSAYGAA